MITIAIDHGNRNIKTCHNVFSSGCKDYSERPIALVGDTIFYDGRYWALTSDPLSYKPDKTQSVDFFVLSLFAIAKELTEAKAKTDEEIKLAIGLPPQHIAKLGPTYKEYFKKGKISFRYNEKEFNINIVDCSIFPQGFAAAVSSIEYGSMIFKNSTTYILDIGGITVDLLRFDNGQLVSDVIISHENGISKMCANIKSKIYEATTLKYSIRDVEEILKGNKGASEQVMAIIKNTAEDWVKKIFDDIRQEDVDLRTSPTILLGGGAMLLKDFIEKNPFIGERYYIDDIKANAIGYLMLSKVS